MAIFTNEVLGPVTDAELRATPLPISGTVNVGTVPVTGPLTDAQLRATPVPVFATPTPATTSTVTNVTSSATNQTLLAANANRKKAIFHFEGATQYLKLGAVASSTSYTYKITANNSSVEVEGYTGIIDSLGTAGKAILVTELA